MIGLFYACLPFLLMRILSPFRQTYIIILLFYFIAIFLSLKNGHCNLPTDYHNKQLRSWATTQRSHYRFLCQGKQSHLTEERVQLLDSVGFSWKTREDWGTRFSELKTYHQQFGNCSVPRGYKIFPKLYRWINHQRLELRKFSEGLPSRLKNEQVNLLKGFEI